MSRIMRSKQHMTSPFAFIAEGTVLIILILVLLEYAFQLFDNTYERTSFYIFQLLLSYVITTTRIIQKYGALHILSLVFITTFVFGIGGITTSIFTSGEYDFRELNSLIDVRFPENLLQKTILIYTFYIIMTYFFSKRMIKNDNVNSGIRVLVSYDNRLFRIGKWCVILMLPLAFYYYFLMYTLGEGGRDAIFIYGSNAALGMPFYIRLGMVFYDVGYYIILASFPPKDKFLKMSVVYFLPYTLLLSFGERGDVAAIVLFIMWFAYMVYNFKFSYKFLFILAAVFVVLFQVIAFTRVGDAVESFSFIFLVSLFFFSQSISFNLLPLYMMYENQMPSHWYPYFLDSVIGGVLPASGQNLHTLEVRSSLTHHLCYAINPDYYFAGNSLGTSNIAEFYEFGLVGVLIGAFLLIYFIKVLNTNIFSKRIWLFLSAYCFRLIILSPRGGLLPSIYEVFKLCAIALVILFIARYKIKIKQIF